MKKLTSLTNNEIKLIVSGVDIHFRNSNGSEIIILTFMNAFGDYTDNMAGFNSMGLKGGFL